MTKEELKERLERLFEKVDYCDLKIRAFSSNLRVRTFNEIDKNYEINHSRICDIKETLEDILKDLEELE
jgi:hypothetical protein